MTIQKTITIEVSMYSEASEAALQEHFESFVQEIESKTQNMRHHSWQKSITLFNGEFYPVEIDVSVSTK